MMQAMAPGPGSGPVPIEVDIHVRMILIMFFGSFFLSFSLASIPVTYRNPLVLQANGLTPSSLRLIPLMEPSCKVASTTIVWAAN
jgi:hypothetical protein